MGSVAGGGVVSASRQEQRADGFTDALDALTEILARFPDEEASVSKVWLGKKKKWWRVTVTVGVAHIAFCPRFEAFDDATSFRVRAVELASAR